MINLLIPILINIIYEIYAIDDILIYNIPHLFQNYEDKYYIRFKIVKKVQSLLLFKFHIYLMVKIIHTLILED